MPPKELKLLSLCALVLFAIIAAGSVLRWPEGQMDTTLPVQVVDNIARHGKAVFQEVGLRQIFTNLTMPPEEVCRSSLKTPSAKEDSIFGWHTYLILYPIAPLSFLIPAEVLIPALTALSFVAMLVLAYALLRKRGIPIVESALCALLISCHPAWTYGLFGQAYVDRYFFGLGFLFLFLIDRFSHRMLPLVLCGLACCLINDRLGLICGAFIIGFSIFHWRDYPGLRWKGLLAGMCYCLLSLFFMKVIIANTFYGSFLDQLNPAVFLQNLNNQTFADNLKIFFIFNFIFFGVFLPFDWRALILVAGVAIPNIFGNIGGAEKIGWSTHYHSNYFPILVWGMLSGFACFYQLLPARTRRPASVLALLCLSLLLAGFYPFHYKDFSFNRSNLANHAVYRNIKEIPLYFRASWQTNYQKFGEELRKHIPPHSRVTAPEGVMPLLYKERELDYFPIGLPDADYAVLTYARLADASLAFSGAVSFLSAEEQERLRRCLQARMKRAGYALKHPILFDNGWAIIPRKHHGGRKKRGPGRKPEPTMGLHSATFRAGEAE